MNKSTESAVLKLSNGKEVQVPILQGTDPNEKFLDIRALYAQSGMFLFDPGYPNTGSCHSAVSHSTADGKLSYRGYDIKDLVSKASFMETAFLLIYGDLPEKKELDKFLEIIKDEMIINQALLDFYKGFALNAHPMSIMCSIVGAFSSFVHSGLNVHDPK